jgi:hypothetical protein
VAVVEEEGARVGRIMARTRPEGRGRQAAGRPHRPPAHHTPLAAHTALSITSGSVAGDFT